MYHQRHSGGQQSNGNTSSPVGSLRDRDRDQSGNALLAGQASPPYGNQFRSETRNLKNFTSPSLSPTIHKSSSVKSTGTSVRGTRPPEVKRSQAAGNPGSLRRPSSDFKSLSYSGRTSAGYGSPSGPSPSKVPPAGKAKPSAQVPDSSWRRYVSVPKEPEGGQAPLRGEHQSLANLNLRNSPGVAREVSFSVQTAPAGMDADRKLQVGKCKVCFSAATHPGCDAGGYEKENQDAWVIKENFGGREGIMFAVFDGHGYDGRKVSHALANKLPKMLAASDKFKADGFGEAATQACIDCNSAVKRLAAVNTELSGSTGIMAYLHPSGAQVTVANVGDSRCILGKADPGGTTEGIALSVDHNPMVPEEASRIRKFKGRISPFMNMGRPVGPPRVWLADRDIPGLCMTRSFGDNVAASIGVYSKPDIVTRRLEAEDKYLILCSDGLTEFMTNDEIISMAHKLALNGLSAKDIAAQLIREARRRWRHEEDDVVDDCTAIVVLLERSRADQPEERASTSSRGLPSTPRRVQQTMNMPRMSVH